MTGKRSDDGKADGSLGSGYVPDKYYVVHQSSLLMAESAFEKLRQEGRNCIIIPFVTWEELNNYRIGSDQKSVIARSIIRKVQQLYRSNDPSVILSNYDGRLGIKGDLRNLRKENNDHRVIATAVQANKTCKDKPVILVTQNGNMEVLALHYHLQVEQLKIDRADHLPISEKPVAINVPKDRLNGGNFFSVNLQDPKEKMISQNAGVVCYSDTEAGFLPAFAAVRKGSNFHVVDNLINLFGVYPKSNNGCVNWAQKIAMQLLADKTINLVTLTGSAGTAKTFLALLGAFAQKKDYWQILISRATIQLGNKDSLGFLPGEFEAKMKPWMLPIFDNIGAIKRLVDERSRKEIEGWLSGDKPKIEILDLDKIRGRSIQNCFIIVDEIQNLPPEQVKAIVTRGGEGTKIVLTGDYSPDQIDVPDLDEFSNGLTVINSVMRGSEKFATVHLDQAIRSPLTQDILDRWDKWQNRFNRE